MIIPQIIRYIRKTSSRKNFRITKKFKLKYFINFGAGDGYHALGLLKNDIFDYAYVFEINDKGKKIIYENSKINNLENKIKIFGKANLVELQENLDNVKMRQSLFLIDIEGEEFKMLNEENISMLKESILVIENHSFLSKNEDVKRFFELIKKYYNLEILNNGSRNPYNIKEIDDFDDDEKWLMMSENRKQTMDWLILVPK